MAILAMAIIASVCVCSQYIHTHLSTERRSGSFRQPRAGGGAGAGAVAGTRARTASTGTASAGPGMWREDKWDIRKQ